MKSAKAIVGGAIATLTYLVPVVDDGVVLSEALSAILVFVVAFNGVYWTPNKARA